MNRHVIVFGSLVVLSLSLVSPAIRLTPGFGMSSGLELFGANCLFSGWASVVIGWPMWLANPLYFAGLVFLGFKKYYTTFVLGCVSIGLALCSFTITEIPHMGGAQAVAGLDFGFYLWLLSLAIPTSLIIAREQKKSRTVATATL